MCKIFILFVFMLCCFGCVAQPLIVYKKVNIPVVCNVSVPVKPLITGDVVNDVKNYIIYTNELKLALDVCVNRTINN